MQCDWKIHVLAQLMSFSTPFIVRLPEDDLVFANDSQEEDAMVRQV